MPTYDYECDKGHRFELFQSMKDDPLKVCTECGAPARRRIGPGAGFLFRGDGFYITDYRSKTYKEKAKSESGGGTGDGAPGGGGAAPSAGGAAKGDASTGGAKEATKEARKPAADKPPKKPPPT